MYQYCMRSETHHDVTEIPQWCQLLVLTTCCDYNDRVTYFEIKEMTK
jgi:hypothetical protein